VAKDIASRIPALASANSAERNDAAAAIFRAGAGMLSPVLREWLDETELALCLKLAAETSGGADSRFRADAAEITVGVAVEPERFEAIRAANKSPALADVPPDQDAKEFELDFPGGVQLDILTSRDRQGNGAIARYLQKFGEGIQQVEVATTDVNRATAILQTRFGLQPVYPATRAGANGTRVNFFLVPTSDGGKLLVELVA
jgi:hypothetical protein